MEKKRRKEKKRISNFNGYLSHSSSRVEFELGLGLRLTNTSLLGMTFVDFKESSAISCLGMTSYLKMVLKNQETLKIEDGLNTEDTLKKEEVLNIKFEKDPKD